MKLEDILRGAEQRGIKLTDEEVRALRTVNPDARLLDAALKMYDVSPRVFDVLIEQIVSIAGSPSPSDAGKEESPPSRAGGDMKVTDTTKTRPADSLPEPLTLEKLRSMLPAAEKAATTFEKSPVWEPDTGDAIVGRVKRIIKGNFDLPLVILSEYAEYSSDGKLGTLREEDLRLPTWAVARASEKKVKLVEDYVFLIKKLGERDTGKVNPYVQAVVIALGPDFPK